MQAAPTHAPPPPNALRRGFGAALTMLVAGFLALLVLPAFFSLVIWLGGPALAGIVFAGPGADRYTVQSMGIAAALGWAIAAATWTAFFLDAHPAAVAISVVLTFVLGAIGAVLVVLLVSLRFRRPGEPRDD